MLPRSRSLGCSNDSMVLVGAARRVSWGPCRRLGRRLPTSPQTSIVWGMEIADGLGVFFVGVFVEEWQIARGPQTHFGQSSGLVTPKR